MVRSALPGLAWLGVVCLGPPLSGPLCPSMFWSRLARACLERSGLGWDGMAWSVLINSCLVLPCMACPSVPWCRLALCVFCLFGIVWLVMAWPVLVRPGQVLSGLPGLVCLLWSYLISSVLIQSGLVSSPPFWLSTVLSPHVLHDLVWYALVQSGLLFSSGLVCAGPLLSGSA